MKFTYKKRSGGKNWDVGLWITQNTYTVVYKKYNTKGDHNIHVRQRRARAHEKECFKIKTHNKSIQNTDL